MRTEILYRETSQEEPGANEAHIRPATDTSIKTFPGQYLDTFENETRSQDFSNKINLRPEHYIALEEYASMHLFNKDAYMQELAKAGHITWRQRNLSLHQDAMKNGLRRYVYEIYYKNRLDNPFNKPYIK